MLSWLTVRVIVPFFPVGIDLFLRILVARDVLQWWEILDVKTVAIAGAFFCFLIAIEANDEPKIRSDEQYQNGLKTFRVWMILAGATLAILFGTTTFAELVDVKNGSPMFRAMVWPICLIVSLVVVTFSIGSAIVADARYQFRF
ncbi:hypothetical protein E3U23_06955 [Erythrobacter litoralis]|uniref:hypothetical protein n=1 Tax=Erythrobacter litoralis TaxID=39960 RepID=UPI002435DA04|nr:hypothetical protein [Erythrobacter litoralis]MDG6078929.1 hypothetical protein [Erythrobacter litoralis]